MANEEELGKIEAELQMQQARGEAIRQQIQGMQNSSLEIATAIEALQNVRKVKGDTLVPIGAGVFFSCPKPDFDRVVMNIGAGVMVQKKPDEALGALMERQKKIADAMKSAQEDMSQVISAIDGLTRRASAMGAEEERNVRPAKEQAR
ncbi:MAG: prefoldin subunit alpha [Candidatus Micrarchaeia archaeon]|jgi:prefoldin alpha subunit